MGEPTTKEVMGIAVRIAMDLQEYVREGERGGSAMTKSKALLTEFEEVRRRHFAFWRNVITEVMRDGREEGKPVVHELKILPEYFEAVRIGRKTAEIRRHDRDYQRGDILFLREWDGARLTGQYLCRSISHIVEGGQFGIEQGYSLLSIQ